MSKSGTLLEAVVSFYGNLTTDILAAMTTTRQDISTGDFDYNKTLGSAIKIWLDATEGWLSAVLVSASAPLPTAYLRIGTGTSTVCASVPVLVKAPLQWTDLFQIGGENQIAQASLVVEQFTKGDGITVKIAGVRELESQITAGLYQGLIYTGDKPLVTVMLLYDPTYKEGHTAKAKRKAKGRINRA